MPSLNCGGLKKGNKMKKILLVLACSFALTANALIVSNTSNSFDNTGAQLGKDKVHVSCKAAVAMSYGEVAYYSLSADDGATCVKGYNLGIGFQAAGIVDEGACAIGKMCKIQVYGIHDAVLIDPTLLGGAAAVAGYPVVGSAVAGYVTGGSTVASHSKIGVFLDDAAATGTVQVFIKNL